eukprot:CAMPEP_0198147438 /NCGR_PEP_ID=MMETSP1443-20131203/35677_1 /TAXON_ID=186043 /ORGANISM="Entomoneis sp., Strain CCMP2396" /LENGTH=240 /DNA_ID=CAMNT_0043811777 /DNA_START=383 /DNA_END=1105 /DNA_ORIENTATION=+
MMDHQRKIVPSFGRRRIFSASLALLLAGNQALQFPNKAHAVSSSSSFPATNIITAVSGSEKAVDDLQAAKTTLDALLQNWEKAVIDCTYADVPRELLEQRNKALLLEKAATSALFDKSASVTSCKTNNRIVRDYIGATGKGPVVGLEKKLKSALEFVDPDDLDEYVQNMELVEQALAKSKSLSYTAGKADFSAVNNFAESETQLVLLAPDSNLEQSRQSIVSVVQGLEIALKLLSTERVR